MEEETLDVAEDIISEGEEATESNEDGDEETQEDTEDLSEELAKQKEIARTAWIRTKKAEAELKKLKGAQAEPHIINNPDLSDELRLVARGLSDEAIEKAKVIAKGNGIPLLEALKDDMFIAYQTKVAENKKREDAKLGASKGSGESQDASVVKPDMTRDEHEKAFKKVMGL